MQLPANRYGDEQKAVASLPDLLLFDRQHFVDVMTEDERKTQRLESALIFHQFLFTQKNGYA